MKKLAGLDNPIFATLSLISPGVGTGPPNQLTHPFNGHLIFKNIFKLS
jgi:hypothetical protein